jgi:hypothetical protein
MNIPRHTLPPGPSPYFFNTHKPYICDSSAVYLLSRHHQHFFQIKYFYSVLPDLECCKFKQAFKKLYKFFTYSSSEP